MTEQSDAVETDANLFKMEIGRIRVIKKFGRLDELYDSSSLRVAMLFPNCLTNG